MPKDLTTAQVAVLSAEGTHRVAPSLYLQIRGGNRSWLFRYRYRTKQLWMSFGPARLLTLTEAKGKAIAAQKLLLDGIDPRQARDAERQTTQSITFAEATDAFISAHEAGWSNPQHRYQVRQTLESYAFPVIGKLPVDQVDANHVVKILEPIWFEKTETATRVRSRIEAVLDWAGSAGHRSGDNPARWKGSIRHRLPAPAKVTKVVHHVAVAIDALPGVYAALSARQQTTAKLLRFIMLTAVRFGEAAKMTWAEVDFETEVWTVPAERMKMRRVHRVPLSAEAIAILESLRRDSSTPDELVFNSNIRGKPLSDTALRTLLRKVGPADADTHGLRSTFRDWCAEKGYDNDAAEAALAHSLGSKVTVAYLRSDLFQRRVAVMSDWAKFLKGGGSPS